jgi:hypothetical protein
MKLPFGRPVAYGLLAIVLLVVVGVVAQRYWPELRWIASPQDVDVRPLPRLAPKTTIITKHSEPIVVTRQVVVYKPAPKQAAQLEKKYDLKLAEVDTGKLQYGGEALVTMNEKGEAEVKIAPKRAPFFELGGPFEVGGGLAYSSGHGQGFTVHAGKDLGRVWKLTGKISADLDLYAGQTYGRATVLAVVRF